MFREALLRCAKITDAQAAQLEAHYDLLCRWNKVLNLTRIEGPEEAAERHYCESLFLAAQLPPIPGFRIADIGSGAGFPGFPLAVFRPDCSVALIESHQRKAVFLREATRSFPNVRVVAARAEDVKERFDWVVSRAVSYEDLGSAVLNFGGRVALLTGNDPPPAAWNLDWEVHALPWGKSRYVRVSVSRGTGTVLV